MVQSLPPLTDREILAARPARNDVDPWRAYGHFVEAECSRHGVVEDVATLLLTNRECPLRCTMCDLWKNTTLDTVPEGAIPAQIRLALDQLPVARHIKLYNSGNFFDPRAIHRADHAEIARCVESFDTVIVENHPRFCGDVCLEFQQRIAGQLEVAIGLETVHEPTLQWLNKRMTLDSFREAVQSLVAQGVDVRTFILLKPPGMSEAEGVDWALRAIELAWELGISCCSVVPTRAGNGVMEQMADADLFSPPSLSALEAVLNHGLPSRRGRVFVDLWDAESCAACPHCVTQRIDRLKQMNLTQSVLPRVSCGCEESD